MSAPNQNRRLVRPAEGRRQPGAERGRQGDLQDRPAQRHGAHGREVAERQLQAEREEQECDAELGELFDVAGVGDREAGREPSDQHAREDVADDQRLAKPAGDVAAGHGREQDEREIREEVHARVS